MKRYKIVTVCGCGLGSSLIAKMSIDQIVSENGYNATIEVADGGSAKGMNCDLFVTTPQFEERLISSGIPVVVVSNFVNKQELQEKLIQTLEQLEKEKQES